jgi:hypothetical protein
MRSLRRRLLVGGAAFICLAVIVSAVGLVLLFERHIEHWTAAQLNAHLDQLVSGIDHGANGELQVVRAPADPRFEQPFSGLYWQVSEDGTDRVIRSRSLWDVAMEVPHEARIDDSLHRHQVEGPGGQALYLVQRHVELPQRLGAKNVQASVAIDRAEIRSAVWRFAAAFMPFLLVLAVLLVLAAWIQVSVGLRPLKTMRRRAWRRSARAMPKGWASAFPMKCSHLRNRSTA